jgi:hypothetical protein
MSLRYYHSCVTWPKHLVRVEGGLDDMISDREEVSARQFVNKVGKQQAVELAHELGYTGPTKGYSNPSHPQHQPECMSMEEDTIGAQLYKSRLFGREVWYARVSGVEHVFIPKGWTPTLPPSAEAKGKHVFFSSCPEWPEDLCHVPGGLDHMADPDYSQSITMATFLENVCPKEIVKIAHRLHYTGVTREHNDPSHPDHNPHAKADYSMEEDHHVRYERGQFLGREVYFLVHSAREFAFIPPGWTPSIEDVDWDFEPTPLEDSSPSYR